MSDCTNTNLNQSFISAKKSLICFLFYFLFYFFLYLSYPLNNSLISEGDTWYYVANFNFYLNRIMDFFSGNPSTQFFYPDKLPALNGEPSFGIFLMWALIKLLITNNLWTFYILFTLILSLNSLSVIYLVKKIIPEIHNPVAFISGLIFSCSMFMLANFENINTLYIAPGFAAVYFFYKLIYKNSIIRWGDSFWFVLLMMLQLSSSLYNFCYILVFLLAVVIIKRLDFVKSIHYNRKKWALIIVGGFVLSLVYVLVIVIFPDKKSSHWNFSTNLQALKIFSITLDDFVRVLPNTLYSHGKSLSAVESYQSFFPGFVVLIFLLIGIYKNKLQNKEIYIGALLALIIGLGTYVTIHGKFIILPLGFIYEKFDLYSFFRFPFRIFLLVKFFATLLVATGMQYVYSRIKYKILFLAIVSALVLVENIPFKRTYYDFGMIEREGFTLKNNLLNTDSTVLFLPAGDIMYREGEPKNMNKTIYIFMFWQTIIQKNVINGNSSFHPPHLVELNDAIYKSDDAYKSLLEFCKKYKVSTVVHYRESWNLDDCPLDKKDLESLFKESSINYITR